MSPSQVSSWVNEEEAEKIEQDGETERERELGWVVTPALLNENIEKGVRATEIDEVGELILTSLWIVFIYWFLWGDFGDIYCIY